VNDIAGSVRGPSRGTTTDLNAGPTPEQATAAELFTAISVLRRAARRAAREALPYQPLAPAQSELLRLAARSPGITVADAAQQLRLAPNTVSTLVGRLTDAGLLNRARGTRDGRTALLTITGKAARRLAEFRDLRAELAGRVLAQLPAGDQQALATAAPALLRLAEQMEAL
jgi:DNA-binding MarR family transcriptional regulator